MDRDHEEFSVADLVAVGVLSKLLDSRYPDEPREEMGGTYGVSASVLARNWLGPGASISMFFGANEGDGGHEGCDASVRTECPQTRRRMALFVARLNSN